MDKEASINKIRLALKSSADLKLKIAESMTETIHEVADIIASALKKGNKILFCGNGGSAADSQHLAAELVVRLTGEINRGALPAIALTTDSSILTACSNDFGFENVFSRQVEALGKRGDILFAISTSGNSQNVIQAVSAAQKLGVTAIGLLGNGGGRLAEFIDYSLIVPSNDTQRIQETHITLGHILIALAEEGIFS